MSWLTKWVMYLLRTDKAPYEVNFLVHVFPVSSSPGHKKLLLIFSLNMYKAMDLEWNNLMQLYRLELIVLIATLCKKDWVPGDPGGQPVNCELAVHPCSKTSHALCPGLSSQTAGRRKPLLSSIQHFWDYLCNTGSSCRLRSIRPWLKQLKQKTTELVRRQEWHNGEVEGTGFVQPQKGEFWDLYFCPQIPNRTYREDRARVYCKRMTGNRSWNMRHYDLIHTFMRKVIKYRMSFVRYVTELWDPEQPSLTGHAWSRKLDYITSLKSLPTNMILQFMANLKKPCFWFSFDPEL